MARRRVLTPEQYKENQRAYHKTDKAKEAKRKFHQTVEYKEYMWQYRLTPERQEIERLRQLNRKEELREYRRKNKGFINFLNRTYQANKKRRTPKWANLDKIREFYENCPDGMEVDHIIPLRGKDITGLHIETNLQYLSKSDNSRKGNRFDIKKLLD